MCVSVCLSACLCVCECECVHDQNRPVANHNKSQIVCIILVHKVLHADCLYKITMPLH